MLEQARDFARKVRDGLKELTGIEVKLENLPYEEGDKNVILYFIFPNSPIKFSYMYSPEEREYVRVASILRSFRSDRPELVRPEYQPIEPPKEQDFEFVEWICFNCLPIKEGDKIIWMGKDFRADTRTVYQIYLREKNKDKKDISDIIKMIEK